jgi:hypothetical protein
MIMTMTMLEMMVAVWEMWMAWFYLDREGVSDSSSRRSDTSSRRRRGGGWGRNDHLQFLLLINPQDFIPRAGHLLAILKCFFRKDSIEDIFILLHSRVHIPSSYPFVNDLIEDTLREVIEIIESGSHGPLDQSNGRGVEHLLREDRMLDSVDLGEEFD